MPEDRTIQSSNQTQVLRADDTLHKVFFREMQEQIHLATCAINEGRDLAYVMLRDDVEPEILRRMANHWLDRFGRDPLSEVLRNG